MPCYPMRQRLTVRTGAPYTRGTGDPPPTTAARREESNDDAAPRPDAWRARRPEHLRGAGPRSAFASYTLSSRRSCTSRRRGSMDWPRAGAPHAACAPEQCAGRGFIPASTATCRTRTPDTYVIAEVTHEYHCCLLGKPGTRLADVREVQGHTARSPERGVGCGNTYRRHGSTSWTLAPRRGPGGRGRRRLASLGGHARDGPGVGAGDAGRRHRRRQRGELLGALVAPVLQRDAHARARQRPPRQRTECSPTSYSAWRRAGYRLHTVSTCPSTQQLYEYDYVLRLVGAGTLAAVQAALARIPAARLAGAYEARD